jgi:hypothetical protein
MTTERQELREYLLGQLPEDAANELDARLFSDDDLLGELQDEQDSLIEHYLRGRLTEKESAFFGAQIARSPSLQEKVDSLRVLLAVLEKQPARSTSRLSRFAILLSPAFAIMLCIVAFLYVRESRRNSDLSSQLLALSPAPQPVVNSIGQSSIAVAFLSANVSRGPSIPPEISVPAAASLIELQVELHEPPPGESRWDAEVLRGNEVIWKSSHLPLRQVGQEAFLALFIDTGAIQAGSYVVRYSPSSTPGIAQARSFRVTERR